MNWLYIIVAFVVGTIVVPAIQGVVGNLLTESVKNWWAKRSLKGKHKRIAELQAQLEEITRLHKDRHAQYLELFHLLFINIMIGAGIFAIVVLTFTVPYYLQHLLFSVAAGLFIGVARDDFYTVKMVARLQHYDEYKQKAEKQIDELTEQIAPVQFLPSK